MSVLTKEELEGDTGIIEEVRERLKESCPSSTKPAIVVAAVEGWRTNVLAMIYGFGDHKEAGNEKAAADAMVELVDVLSQIVELPEPQGEYSAIGRVNRLRYGHEWAINVAAALIKHCKIENERVLPTEPSDDRSSGDAAGSQL